MELAASVLPEFPSILEADSLAPSSYQAAMFHLRQGLQAVYDLAPGGESPRRIEHGELISMLEQVIQLLHIQFAPTSSADSERRFGDILRQHRDEAGLTQEQLAEYSGLSLSLLRKLEQRTLLAEIDGAEAQGLEGESKPHVLNQGTSRAAGVA